MEQVEHHEEIITDRADAPAAKIRARRVDWTEIGALAGQVDLTGDWDSPQTNAEIARDFGLGGEGT